MTEQVNQTTCRPAGEQPDDEINLLDYWRVIWKRRWMIGGIAFVAVFASVIISLFMTNIYQARAVIMPVAAKDGGAGNAGLAIFAQQFGGLPVAMPGSTSASEIVSLLKSKILREKVIHQYNLMPVLFSEQWDTERRSWKKNGASLNPARYLSRLSKAMTSPPSPGAATKDPDVPDTWDSLRLLDEIVRVNQDVKQNTITISVELPNPDMAAKVVEYFLVTLTNYMSGEAKRVAATNRKYLEEQLGSTTDPFIKQKTYNMIAQQIETGMMAEVKENFAFKVIDPPLAPDREIKPRRGQMVILTLFGALFAGILAAFFGEYRGKLKAGRQT